MKKSELFDMLLERVCEECEVRCDLVLKGSRIQAVVDARLLCVQYLRRIGLNNDDIALVALRRQAGDNNLCPPLAELKKKSKSIDKMFKAYSDRCMQSYAFCLASKEIAKFCREQYQRHFSEGMKTLPKGER